MLEFFQKHVVVFWIMTFMFFVFFIYTSRKAKMEIDHAFGYKGSDFFTMFIEIGPSVAFGFLCFIFLIISLFGTFI